MKMIYGGVPVNSLKVKHYELNTNSATVQPSDLQAGITCFARGQKVIGTGKAFSFAFYGKVTTNFPNPIPSNINVIQISALDYPLQSTVAIRDVKTLDLSNNTLIANIIVDGISYPINISIANNMATFTCDKKIYLQVFYGKDDYV